MVTEQEMNAKIAADKKRQQREHEEAQAKKNAEIAANAQRKKDVDAAHDAMFEGKGR
jgi:hypothetical protein